MWAIYRRKESIAIYFLLAGAALVFWTFNPSPSLTASETDPIGLRLGLRPRNCDLCEVFEDHGGLEFECIPMSYDPPPTICLYNDDMDRAISGRIRRTGSWEGKYISAMTTWLGSVSGSGLIDIGANIGVFTLVAATKGYEVISVEPNIENAWRLRASVELSEVTDRVTILHNAVSDERGVAKVIFFRGNQGLTTVEMVNSTKSNTSSIYKASKVDAGRSEGQLPDSRLFTKTIHLDDLVHYCNFQDAIMKIDIEGFEHRAFQRAAILFSHIRIHKVMMEWLHIRKHLERGDPEQARMIREMLDFFVSRGYRALDWNMDELDVNDVMTWPTDLVWSLDRNKAN